MGVWLLIVGVATPLEVEQDVEEDTRERGERKELAIPSRPLRRPSNGAGFSSFLSGLLGSVTKTASVDACPGKCIHALASLMCDTVLEEVACPTSNMRCCVEKTNGMPPRPGALPSLGLDMPPRPSGKPTRRDDEEEEIEKEEATTQKPVKEKKKKRRKKQTTTTTTTTTSTTTTRSTTDESAEKKDDESETDSADDSSKTSRCLPPLTQTILFMGLATYVLTSL